MGPDPDARLIADCANFHAAFERERAATGGGDGEHDSLGRATAAALGRIVGVVPVTAAGLAAKASAALTRLLWQAAPVNGVPWRDQATAGERIALECLALVAGRQVP